MFRRLLILLLIESCAILCAAAQSFAATRGFLDTTFAANGHAYVRVGITGAAAAVAIQRDGRIVTAGQATVGGENVIVSTRMTSNGRLDPSYGRSGVVVINPGTGAGMDSGAGLALQANGDIVIAGTARSDGGVGPLSFAAVRLRPNGELDHSFGDRGIANVPIGRLAIANAIAIEPSGRIVLGGTALLGHYTATVAQLEPNGSLDRKFGNDGVVIIPRSSAAWALVRMRDGGLILGGQARLLGAGVYMAARLDQNGALDRDFGNGGVVEVPIGPIGSTATGLAMAQQSDGKVVLTGDATVYGVKLIATARFRSDGSLDPTFARRGVSTLIEGFGANGMAIERAGDVLIVGGGDSVLRLEPTGKVDTTFGARGRVLDPLGTHDSANGVAVEPRSGRLVLAGGALVAGHLVLSVLRLNR